MHASLLGCCFESYVIDNDIIGSVLRTVRGLEVTDETLSVEAIREACRRLKTLDLAGAELYTSCEPCPMCTSVMYLAGISKLYYAASAEDPSLFGSDPSRLRREVGKAVAERAMASEQVMEEEGRALLLEWAKSLNG